MKLCPFLAAAMLLAVWSPGKAQETTIAASAGPWFSDTASSVYSLALYKPFIGPFDYGIGISHLTASSGAESRLVTGGEVSVGLFRQRPGPYGVAAASLGMEHSSGDFDAAWSVGGGYSVTPVGPVSLGLEVAYRVEDRSTRGFWRLDPAGWRGVLAQVQLKVALGRRSRSGSRSETREPAVRPERTRDTGPPAIPQPRADGPREVAAFREAVVETALDVMGTPYQWGGDEEGGFDCSGLIHYAYGERGLILPRTSRDQARMGMQVSRNVDELQPGDILAFSDRGGPVTHVGLYVGDGLFIHSSSSGVMLSSLVSSEGDGRWWRQRWVSARRIIN